MQSGKNHQKEVMQVILKVEYSRLSFVRIRLYMYVSEPVPWDGISRKDTNLTQRWDGIGLVLKFNPSSFGTGQLKSNTNPSGGTGSFKNCTIPSDPKSSDGMNLTSVPLDGVVCMNSSSSKRSYPVPA